MFAGHLGRRCFLSAAQPWQNLCQEAEPPILIVPHFDTNLVQDKSGVPRLRSDATLIWLMRILRKGCSPSATIHRISLLVRALY